KARKTAGIACLNPCTACQCDINSPVNNLYTDYYIYSNRFHLYSTETIHDGVSVITNYEYTLNQNTPTALTSTESDGATKRTEWVFPASPNSNAPSEMFDATNPVFKNMIALPVEQREYKNGTLVNKVQNTYASTAGNLVLAQT